MKPPRVSPDPGPATSRHHRDAARQQQRRLVLHAPRLDDAVHSAVQMALLGLLRAHAPDLAAIEDLRLALDEVLLDTAIVEARDVVVDVSVGPDGARVVVEVDGSLDVPETIVQALVDVVEVDGSRASTTSVVLQRRWAPRSSG